MSVQNSPFGSYHFGPFHVDAPAGQLRKRGSKIRLAGQPLEILVMLLERPGQVITREEIQQRLWPEQTFVDFENSLNKAINKLRQALSDSADEPVYIETLPRRGYRFVGTLLPPPQLEPESVPEQIAPFPSLANEPAAPPRRHLPWRFIAVSALLPIFAFAWFALRPLPPPRVLGASPLTDSSRV